MSDSKRSMLGKGNSLAQPQQQVALLESDSTGLSKFEDKLANLGMHPLQPSGVEILQVNVGYMCNQVCTHCHVDAGPDRKEIMTREVMQHCLNAIDNSDVHTVDLTGGAPEMNPDFLWFVEELSKRKLEIIVRSNLTILVSNEKFRTYPAFLKEHGVTVIASLPCYTQENVDKQRGAGVFGRSIEAIRILNELGYGQPDSDLKLHLVYNPVGASIAGDQAGLERDYKLRLKEDLNLVFNNLYTITNLPISRFLDYLVSTDKYQQYMETLVNAFNPSTIEGVMCRNTLSVRWDGHLYDCDFNQMLDLPLAKSSPQHIRDFSLENITNRTIAIGQHCYGCTAGAGSSCQGALV